MAKYLVKLFDYQMIHRIRLQIKIESIQLQRI